MDDACATARHVGVSRTTRQAVAGQQACHAPNDGTFLNSLDASFETDLTVWLERLYAVRAERQGMRRLQRVYAVGWLAIVAMTVALLLLGPIAALGALLLLVVTLGMGWWLVSAARLEDPRSRGRVPAHGQCRSYELPEFGSDERARLVRLMNLSRTAWRPATRMLLRAELHEARTRGALADWGVLYDLEDVVLAGPFATARTGD
jgi:hypothetical protein